KMKLIFGCIIWSILVIAIQAKDIPNCEFLDTVNITGSFRFPNGSYKYEDLIIPPELTGVYDYKIQYGGDSESVPNHTRGCVCKLKPCIRFCCHHKQFLVNGVCVKDIDNTIPYNYTMDITKSDGKVNKMHVLNDMVAQQDLHLPCAILYHLDRDFEWDNWTLYENGNLFRHYDQKNLAKQEYCIQPKRIYKENWSVIILVAYNCAVEPTLTMAYVKSCSAFFMAITILIYLWLPKFRSLHGKCCILYFTCLTTTFALNVISMFRVLDDFTIWCWITGYAGYFTVMATFLWLSIISFDVWRRFARRFHDFYNNSRSGFFNYNVIVFSTAGILTLMIYLLDLFFPVDIDTTEIRTPAVGINSCWILTNGYSALLYFYSPLAILISFNGAMFFLTTRHIYLENKSNQKALNRNEHQRKSRNQANYRVYLRLFIIMGGSWILEIISVFCEMENTCKVLVHANEVINCSQGMMIFLATFCNRDMIHLIRKR
ncbi:hypothetical protein KR009_010134, partial [Drosophila setifemur]